MYIVHWVILTTINCCQKLPNRQCTEIYNTEMTLQERLREFIRNNFRFLLFVLVSPLHLSKIEISCIKSYVKLLLSQYKIACLKKNFKFSLIHFFSRHQITFTLQSFMFDKKNSFILKTFISRQLFLTINIKKL